MHTHLNTCVPDCMLVSLLHSFGSTKRQYYNNTAVCILYAPGVAIFVNALLVSSLIVLRVFMSTYVSNITTVSSTKQ